LIVGEWVPVERWFSEYLHYLQIGAKTGIFPAFGGRLLWGMGAFCGEGNHVLPALLLLLAWPS
jgi:hypothetical protein